ncbi:phosphate acetyltransferase [Psychromarinibacter sp. C21-152]|uniref:Phosphate acetyltransferase n=1 Tax=Psychromarinibacter sediminicola TaxID=3033385 RepID=A0AAE3NNR0_9RHOB|nr:phosphate acetyltransferase [Psychromarinibacter sediminicola]MDF0599646.1 phosphate acetyltransferase [Psychromarinibacter sediminicola]
MRVGAAAEIARTYTAADLDAFAALSGAGPGETVPEPLIAALFSYLLGVELPGPGTNYLKQELRFLGSAPLGARLTARVEVTRVRPEKHLVDLRATCALADGTVVCEGRSLVKAKDVVAAG